MKRQILFYVFFLIVCVCFLSGEGPIFIDSGQNLGGVRSHGADSGDLDGDGDLDIFVSNHSDTPNEVWFNDGTGHFTDSGQSLGNSSSYNVKLQDLDGDGDLDAFVTNYYNQPNKVWFNNGFGFFTDSGQNLGNTSSLEAALEDLDGDGDFDAFVANYPFHPNKVWFNNGDGYFTDSGQNLGNSQSHGVALGDLDGDGDFDAFVANSGYPPTPNKVWFNNGFGFFTDSGQNLGYLPSKDICLGDLNNDGHLDAFVSNVDNPNKVWINDGSGYFTDSGQDLGNGGSYCAVLEDVDGDGDQDAFVANFPSQPNKVWLNNGLGTFSDSGLLLGNNNSLWVEIKDFNGDISPDAYVSNTQYPDKVWFNQTSFKIDAFIDLAPDTLNLKSKGKWVTAYIEFPEGNDVNDIEVNTVELSFDDMKISADRGYVQGDLYMAKFSRSALIDILNGINGDVELEVTGKAADKFFEGTDTISVK